MHDKNILCDRYHIWQGYNMYNNDITLQGYHITRISHDVWQGYQMWQEYQMYDKDITSDRNIAWQGYNMYDKNITCMTRILSQHICITWRRRAISSSPSIWVTVWNIRWDRGDAWTSWRWRQFLLGLSGLPAIWEKKVNIGGLFKTSILYTIYLSINLLLGNALIRRQ